MADPKRKFPLLWATVFAMDEDTRDGWATWMRNMFRVRQELFERVDTVDPDSDDEEEAKDPVKQEAKQVMLFTKDPELWRAFVEDCNFENFHPHRRAPRRPFTVWTEAEKRLEWFRFMRRRRHNAYKERSRVLAEYDEEHH